MCYKALKLHRQPAVCCSVTRLNIIELINRWVGMISGINFILLSFVILNFQCQVITH